MFHSAAIQPLYVPISGLGTEYSSMEQIHAKLLEQVKADLIASGVSASRADYIVGRGYVYAAEQLRLHQADEVLRKCGKDLTERVALLRGPAAELQAALDFCLRPRRTKRTPPSASTPVPTPEPVVTTPDPARPTRTKRTPPSRTEPIVATPPVEDDLLPPVEIDATPPPPFPWKWVAIGTGGLALVGIAALLLRK